ncbi:hypothetical protein ACFL4G_05690 [Thermodesulfobacteriota bacterium]
MNKDAGMGKGKDEPIKIPTFVALLLISVVLWLFQKLAMVLRIAQMSLVVPRWNGYPGGRGKEPSNMTRDRLNNLH